MDCHGFWSKGRLVVSDQDNSGTFIIDLPPVEETLQESMIEIATRE